VTEPKIRAVLDTNIVVAALLSRNPSSPTAEIIRRWRDDEFELLYSSYIREEYAEKLLDRGADLQRMAAFMNAIDRMGIRVFLIEADIIPRVPGDLDDDAVIACAISGGATHLVTYDAHLHALGEEYEGVHILDGLHFLYVLRGDVPPSR
jgi:putative PIN family toxin of toxin-antitoxin system